MSPPHDAHPGETVRMSGRSSLAGQGVLELVCRRDCLKEQPPVRERFDPTDKALEGFQEDVYQQSLDRCWAHGRWIFRPAILLRKLLFPKAATDLATCGCWWRRLAQGALGATNLIIKPQPIATAQAGEGGRGDDYFAQSSRR